MSKSVKRKTTDGLIWNTLERFVSRGIQFVFSILIARILMPEDYGIITIANIVIALSDILVDSGFSKALLRKKEKTEEDYNTVFYFNIAISGVLYLLIWFISPLIAEHFDIPVLTQIIRILSLMLVLNALCGVQYLHIIAEMNFKKKAIIETVSICISGIVALIMAYNGMGIWALVVQTILACFIRTILFWLLIRWIPAFNFSLGVLKSFFRFGVGVLLTEYIGRIYSAVFSFSIGKIFSTTQLGYYGKADAFASQPAGFISGPLSAVSYPALAEIQDDRHKMTSYFYLMMGQTCFVVFPLILGLLSATPWLVPVVLKSQWNAIVPFMQVLLLSYMWSTLMTIPNNYLLILGRSKAVLLIQLLSKAFGLVLFFTLLLFRTSLLGVCVGIAIVSFFSLYATLFYLHRLIKFKWTIFFRNVFPSLINSLVMSALVLVVCYNIKNMTMALLVGILIGLFIYVVLSIITDRNNLRMSKSLLQPYLKR